MNAREAAREARVVLPTVAFQKRLGDRTMSAFGIDLDLSAGIWIWHASGVYGFIMLLAGI